PPGEQPAREGDAEAVGPDGPEGDGGEPAGARQLPARQGVLADARGEGGAARAELRGGRPGRDGGPRDDLPRRRQRLAAGAERGRAPPVDRGGGPGAGGAGHAVPGGGPRAGREVEGRAEADAGLLRSRP